jgi:hypothetical protein
MPVRLTNDVYKWVVKYADADSEFYSSKLETILEHFSGDRLESRWYSSPFWMLGFTVIESHQSCEAMFKMLDNLTSE